MHFLLVHLLLAVTASASPLWRHLGQQILSPFSQPKLPHGSAPQGLYYTPSSYLDVRPNAVALALTWGDDHEHRVAEYFFLPMGRSVKTHVTSELPLHPRTAHIIGAVDWEGRVVPSQEMEGVECTILPVWNRTLNAGREDGDFALRISSLDGMVDLREGDEAMRLGAREVEAYECRWIRALERDME